MTDTGRNASQVAALQAAFKNFYAADAMDSVLEEFELFKTEAMLLGCEGPAWKALPLANHRLATELHEIMKAEQESSSDNCTPESPGTLHGLRVVVVGGGPGGYRTAVEALRLGATVTVLEQRTHLSRNNVLKLWEGVVDDCVGLGLKFFHRAFGSSASNKCAIRRIQLLLLKLSLMLGVDLKVGVAFKSILLPNEMRKGYEIELESASGEVDRLPCDVLVGADGEHSRVARNSGFEKHYTQFSNAVGITFNFVYNKKRTEEVRLPEASRAGHFFRAWLREVYQRTGLQLENFVYWKDETHYFVMATKPHCLVEAGIAKETKPTLKELLLSENIDSTRLCMFAQSIARCMGLPEGIPFALNNRGNPDMGIFDFTKKLHATASSRILAGPQPLLVTLVGDALIAPFWPMGTGCNRAFLSALDASYMMKNFATSLRAPEADRERLFALNLAEQMRVYQALRSNTALKPNHRRQSHSPSQSRRSWTLDPSSRYVGFVCEHPEDVESTLGDAIKLYVRASSSMLTSEDDSDEDCLVAETMDMDSMMSQMGSDSPHEMGDSVRMMMGEMGFDMSPSAAAEEAEKAMATLHLVEHPDHSPQRSCPTPTEADQVTRRVSVSLELYDFLQRHPGVQTMDDIYTALKAELGHRSPCSGLMQLDMACSQAQQRRCSARFSPR